MKHVSKYLSKLKLYRIFGRLNDQEMLIGGQSRQSIGKLSLPCIDFVNFDLESRFTIETSWFCASDKEFVEK